MTTKHTQMTTKHTQMTTKQLPNIGSSCFINASLQSLWNCDHLVDLFNKKHSHSDICKTIYDIMKTNDCVRQNIKLIISKLDIPYGTEYDAAEFIVLLLGEIQKETPEKQIGKLNIIQQKIKSKSLDHYEKFWKNELSTINEIVFAQQFDQYSCSSSNCDYDTINICYFNTLILYPQNNNDDICSMMQKHSKNNVHVDEIKCEKCKNKSIVNSTYISIWPKVLICNISRNNFKVKLNKVLLLDKQNYVLKSVICYIGNTHSGHYYSIINKNNEWINCDDQNIYKCDNPCNNPSNSYYIAIYELS